MANFVQDLWESIFTPGPTPSLLIATNVTFACLQVVLFGLLLATYSVHFFVLSGLCAGLWWSVNWFARELKVAQLKEREQEQKTSGAAGRATSVESDTETEVETVGRAKTKRPPGLGSSEVEAVENPGDLKHRSMGGVDPSPPGSKSGVSTEDEWEKVSENEHEKEQ